MSMDSLGKSAQGRIAHLNSWAETFLTRKRRYKEVSGAEFARGSRVRERWRRQVMNGLVGRRKD